MAIKFIYPLVVCAALSFKLLAAPDFIPGRILLKPKPSVSPKQVRSILVKHSAVPQAEISQIGVRIIRVPSEKHLAILQALQNDPDVEFAESDRLLPPDMVPNDPYYSSQWHLSKIQAPQAWDISTGSSSVIIAILDTGIDSTHPDLAGKLVPGWNFYDNNSNTTEVYPHGSAVAGTAAALSNNGMGVASLAWGSLIMPIRVSDTNGFASSSTMANGLTWAADHGARVANISYAVTDSATVTSAAQYFQSKNGVVTVSAGNSSTFDATADNPYVLTVSATDTPDTLATWSNTGNNVDLAAPGVSIVTTGGGGTYVAGTGTSFSAPIVAGVAALVISANPALTGDQVQTLLKQTADDLGPPGWDPSYGWGRVNAYKAVLAATGGTSPPADTTAPSDQITAPSTGSTIAGTVSVTVSASDNVSVTKVELYVDGTLFATSLSPTPAFPWDTTKAPNGPHSVKSRAYDAAGNYGDSAIVSVSVSNAPPPDTTPPAVQITSPANGAIISGTISISAGASDNVGVTKVELYRNGALIASTASVSWDTTTAPNASYTLQAKAYDAAGNVGSSALVTVTVSNAPPLDTTPPSVQIISPGNGATVSGTVTTSITGSDNVGVIRLECYLDTTLIGSISSGSLSVSWNTTTASNGSHTLKAIAYDAAGNSTAASVAVSVSNTPPDTTPPTVQITSPANGSTISKTVKISVGASDNTGVTQVQLYIDGAWFATDTAAPYTFSWSSSKVTKGAHTLQAIASDAAGNVASSAVVTVFK